MFHSLKGKRAQCVELFYAEHLRKLVGGILISRKLVWVLAIWNNPDLSRWWQGTHQAPAASRILFMAVTRGDRSFRWNPQWRQRHQYICMNAEALASEKWVTCMCVSEVWEWLGEIESEPLNEIDWETPKGCMWTITLKRSESSLMLHH